MRAWLMVVVVSLIPLSGCIGEAKSDDPFAYMSKPLYTSSFDLDSFAGATDGQQFRVEDGSIMTVNLRVTVNATAGSAKVTITNPSGHAVISDATSIERRVPVELGVWHVDVEATDDASGRVDVFVVRG